MKGATNLMKNKSKKVIISIHAPCEGSDGRLYLTIADIMLFQSTLPVKGATTQQMFRFFRTVFQSTLPVKGATRKIYLNGKISDYFNPRSL